MTIAAYRHLVKERARRLNRRDGTKSPTYGVEVFQGFLEGQRDVAVEDRGADRVFRGPDGDFTLGQNFIPGFPCHTVDGNLGIMLKGPFLYGIPLIFRGPP